MKFLLKVFVHFFSKGFSFFLWSKVWILILNNVQKILLLNRYIPHVKFFILFFLIFFNLLRFFLGFLGFLGLNGFGLLFHFEESPSICFRWFCLLLRFSFFLFLFWLFFRNIDNEFNFAVNRYFFWFFNIFHRFHLNGFNFTFNCFFMFGLSLFFSLHFFHYLLCIFFNVDFGFRFIVMFAFFFLLLF